MQPIQIHRVLAALGCGAGGEEEGIDVVDASGDVEDKRCDEDPGYYVDIINGNE